MTIMNFWLYSTSHHWVLFIAYFVFVCLFRFAFVFLLLLSLCKCLGLMLCAIFAYNVAVALEMDVGYQYIFQAVWFLSCVSNSSFERDKSYDITSCSLCRSMNSISIVCIDVEAILNRIQWHLYCLHWRGSPILNRIGSWTCHLSCRKLGDLATLKLSILAATSRPVHHSSILAEPIRPSPRCSDGQENQTTEHILLRCPNHDSLRRTTWPTETALQTKLYGYREELVKTAQCTSLTGLTV